MLVKQISVFLENKAGRIAKVTKYLSKNNIDINALCIADTTDFGILRLIVNDPDKAKEVLKDGGFTVSCTDVIAVGIKDTPGALADVLDIIDKKEISIEYLYAFAGKDKNKAYVILRVENPKTAIESLLGSGYEVLGAKEVYTM